MCTYLYIYTLHISSISSPSIIPFQSQHPPSLLNGINSILSRMSWPTRDVTKSSQAVGHRNSPSCGRNPGRMRQLQEERVGLGRRFCKALRKVPAIRKTNDHFKIITREGKAICQVKGNRRRRSLPQHPCITAGDGAHCKRQYIIG